MENREIKKPFPAELDDDAMEKVNGGLHTIILGEYDQTRISCADCHRAFIVWKDRTNEYLVDGRFYCPECRAKLSPN